jgi:FMN-dependent NADH-azoreductase
MEKDVFKRLEFIEYFILKKKKNDAESPTVIDLCNNRITAIDTEFKESIQQMRQKQEEF